MLVALSGACAASGASVRVLQPSAADPRIRESTAFVDSTRHALKIPGMALTVLRDGQVVVSAGFGFADVARPRDATPDTRFRVGSVSKLFTAVALMRLVEARVLDLDAPVRRYLGEKYPARWPDVTLRQLASHTAGVRHYRGAEFFSRTSYPTLLDAMGIFAGDSLLFAPGSAYSYSSHGYTVIGAAMERVTGSVFPDLLQRQVLQPLSMRRTVPDSGRAIEGRAVPYDIGTDEVTVAATDDLSSRWPAGGYLSTTTDLARFGWLALRPGFLDETARRELVTPQRLVSGDSIDVAIGWRKGTDSAGRRYLHHGGSSNGGSAFLLVYPDEGLVVSMAANAYARWGMAEALHVASIFLRP
jgi:CubicO group peptidase (beta-lactamase class C family)